MPVCNGWLPGKALSPCRVVQAGAPSSSASCTSSAWAPRAPQPRNRPGWRASSNRGGAWRGGRGGDEQRQLVDLAEEVADVVGQLDEYRPRFAGRGQPVGLVQGGD